MKKLLTPVICLASVFFLTTNLLAWLPDLPDLNLSDVDRDAVHAAGTGYPIDADDGWVVAGGFWPNVTDPSYFAYWSPGENENFYDVMWIFVKTNGTSITAPVVSMESEYNLLSHIVSPMYSGDTNYSPTSYWPTVDPEDWSLWVFYIDPASATEIIYFTQNMHEYDMEIYSQYFIPEPTTILLLLGSVIGLFVKKFKK